MSLNKVCGYFFKENCCREVSHLYNKASLILSLDIRSQGKYQNYFHSLPSPDFFF